MARYHINPRTGDPGACSARISCPFGNLESDHFDSKEDARAAYEEGRLDQAFVTLQRTLDEVTDPYEAVQSDDQLLAALDRAVAEDDGWAYFDPSKGVEQLDQNVDEAPEGFDHLTDETQEEMDAYYFSLSDPEDEFFDDAPFIPEDQNKEPPF